MGIVASTISKSGVPRLKIGSSLKAGCDTNNVHTNYRNCTEPLINMVLTKSERRDLNPRPPLPQSGALPSCATPRKSDIENRILKFY